jgi:hypothetical protein
LFGYGITMWSEAYRMDIGLRASRGLSVALFIVLLVRSITETPLSVAHFLTGAFMSHLLLFHIALAYGQRVVHAARPETATYQRRSSFSSTFQ